jgi:hypothetical protein
VVSDRIRERLAKIAGRVPDGDADSTEPLVAVWSDFRIALDDAEDLCTCLELADALVEWNDVFGTAETDGFVRSFVFLVGVAQEYESKHGTTAARRMLRNLVQLMGETATVETVQLVNAKEHT